MNERVWCCIPQMSSDTRIYAARSLYGMIEFLNLTSVVCNVLDYVLVRTTDLGAYCTLEQ